MRELLLLIITGGVLTLLLLSPIPPKGDGRRGGFDDQRNVKRESDTRRPGATMAELLSAVPVGTSTTESGTAWLAFGNAGATEMLMNWVHHVCKLGMGARTVIAAYDAELLATLRGLRIPAYNYTGALPQIHFRGTPFLFHRMGYLKAMTIREVLLTGRHVLVSDSDVAWVRDPLPELEALAAAGASLAPATDCLHIEADRDKSERPNAPYLCGHQPGSRSGAVFNTGIIFLAATNATVHFCERWAEATLHLPAEQWWSDDQGVFNKLLTGHGTWPFAATGFYPPRALDPRIRLRAHAFLSDPRTDADILRSSATVRSSSPAAPRTSDC
ncbi:glycosyltransferase family 77 protein [Chrysochromulina tobinii]|uniref:Glycosyltransferase family 77 protein n=1 Tax=Chrysochromulina tobinii TaxID=1460289 RepID=A0A0M0JU21_9EUKA|nr:glycosyltransferase family 77 protein [Chrysochromulina tobinii]|eukprot:KOO29623.1 glycosyltransferase family 77 protein [Chrysochromulina sp. CCMP291]